MRLKSTRRLILVTVLGEKSDQSNFTQGINVICIVSKDAIYSQIWLQTQAVRLSHMVDNLRSREAFGIHIKLAYGACLFFAFRANLQCCIRVHRQRLIYGLTRGQSFYLSFSVCTTQLCVSGDRRGLWMKHTLICITRDRIKTYHMAWRKLSFSYKNLY